MDRLRCVGVSCCLFVASVALVCAMLVGCGDGSGRVVVYTSLDRDISEPVLAYVATQTGLDVVAKYDAEATKTTGLYQLLLAEKVHPKADIFWNSEVARTVQLANKGVLEPYRSPQLSAYPEGFYDPEGYWTGFAARARVIVYNTRTVPAEEAPRRLSDLLDTKWKGQVGVAKPFFGTTSTHAGALYLWNGRPGLVEFFTALKANEVKFLPGNATVRDQVADGVLKVGLTDTDDVWGALANRRPVAMIYPDADTEGTLLIPNTVALIRGGPNPEGARKVIDALLSSQVEEMLANARGRQIPLRTDSTFDAPGAGERYRPVDYKKVAEVLPDALEALRPLF